MKNIATWLQRTKAQLDILPVALDALDAGDLTQATTALQMSGLTREQLFNGCMARLESAYVNVNGYGPQHKVGANRIWRAYNALTSRGVKNILAPQYGVNTGGAQ
jgi:hypothetical protein